MRCIQVLSALALRRVLLSTCQERNGSDVFAADQFPHDNHHLPRALRQANARAWIAIEVLLTGEALWERAQLTWKRSLEEEFFRPVRVLLDKVSLARLDDTGADSRRDAAQALQAALESSLLTSGPLEIAELLPAIREGANDDDPTEPEWRALTRLADHLEQLGYPELRPLFNLRTESGDSFLVVMVAALFRQAVDDDPDLFGSLAASWAAKSNDVAIDALRPLAAALDRHGARFDALLRKQEPGADAAGSHSPPIDTAGGATRLQRGLACAQRGEYEQAIGEYTAALQLDSASAQAFLHRGDAHRRKGDYAQALADYGTALRLDPAGVMALIQRGQVHWTMGQVQEALADFNAALEIDPRNAVAYHYRGKALADSGDYDGAVVNFSEALRIDPYYAWAHHDSGEAYAATGNYSRAIADFSEAIRLNPLTTLSYLRRGNAHAALKDFDRAVADYTNASRLDPNDALAYQCLGVAYREQGKYDKAAAEFTKALELDYGNGRLYFERGLLFQMQANHERALLDFNAAIGRNSADPEMYYRRGLTYEALGDSEGALADLSKALRLNPSHAAAYNSRGMLYSARNEVDLALPDFNAALSMDPDFTAAYLNRAKVLAQAGQLGQAAADCDDALARDPHMALAYLVRGRVRAQQGAFPAAIDDFSQALRLSPINAQAFYFRGMAHLKIDNPRQAILDLTEAIRLDPGHARAYAQRAAIREAAGRSELALADLAHAARLDVLLVPAYLRQLGIVHSAREMHECAVADYTAALSFDQDDADALAGRDRAWKAFLQRSRSRKRLAKRPPRLGPTRATMVPGVLAEVPPDQGLDGESSGVIAGQETGVHQLGRKTGTDHRILEEGTADAEDTSYTLNIPETLNAPEGTAAPHSAPTPVAGDNAQTPTITGVQQDESLSIEALKGTMETPPPQPQPRLELPVTPDEMKARAEAEQTNRERLEYLKAEEERSRRKKRKQRDADEDDDDDRWPYWKKGILIAASVLMLYWVGSAASGFFADARRTSKPRTTPLAGKVVELGDQPLVEARLRFHPRDDGGIPAFAATKHDGTFKVSTFSRDDGIIPGNYVVTIEATRASATLIPRRYQSVTTSPLTIEIKPGDEALPIIKLRQ